MEREIKKVLQLMTQSQTFSKKVDIQQLLNRKKKRWRTTWIVVASLASFLFTWNFIESPSSIANLLGAEKIKPLYQDDYIIYNGYYYVSTNETISKKELGNKLGEVKQKGERVFKQEGDTNGFLPGYEYYAIQGLKVENKIAIEVWYGREPSYYVLERKKPVEEINTNTVFEGKADMNEVEVSLENIRKVIPFLKEMHSPDLQLSFITLKNDKVHYYTKLKYTHTRFDSRSVFVRIYEKGFGDNDPDLKLLIKHDGDLWFDEKQEQHRFIVNDVEWVQYGPQPTFRSIQGNFIYDVTAPGYAIGETKQLLELLYKN